MEAFTENLIEEFIGFDNDCEIESDNCSDEATCIQKIQGMNQENILECNET